MLVARAISQFVYAKRRQGSAPTGGMLVEGATTAVIEMPQELGQLMNYYDMWEHLWILQILSNRLLGLAEMVPSFVSNCGVDLGHSLGFPSEEHLVAVLVGGCDGAADRRLQGRGALKEADGLNPVRVDSVAILHVEEEVLRDDGNRGMFMLAQIKSMATTMADVYMTQMVKVNINLVRFPACNPVIQRGDESVVQEPNSIQSNSIAVYTRVANVQAPNSIQSNTTAVSTTIANVLHSDKVLPTENEIEIPAVPTIVDIVVTF
ncbi:hypothetical protein NE237_009467 [Protea cynaroides]|uniref:Uncharacterized protein n=1 Tax=Protea cynaroides TaxID=273540 RepID=A0A9Q0R0N3_9MAGN|nr:hypothetical protein NE237_009467 [Protea cynaroides]